MFNYNIQTLNPQQSIKPQIAFSFQQFTTIFTSIPRISPLKNSTLNKVAFFTPLRIISLQPEKWIHFHPKSHQTAHFQHFSSPSGPQSDRESVPGVRVALKIYDPAALLRKDGRLLIFLTEIYRISLFISELRTGRFSFPGE